MTLRQGQAKEARLNGARLPSAESLRRELSTLVFTPDRLTVVKGGPAARRAYFDRVLGRLFPARACRAAGLPRRARAAERRAAARAGARSPTGARSSRGPSASRSSARCSSSCAARRSTRWHRPSPSGPTSSACRTRGSDTTPSHRRRELLEARLAQDIERGDDRASAHTSTTCSSRAATRDLRQFGSQGEQRLAVLSLLLAEAELLPEPPLLLLDDVLSELDLRRRRGARRTRCGYGPGDDHRPRTPRRSRSSRRRSWRWSLEPLGTEIRDELARFGPQAGMAELLERWPAGGRRGDRAQRVAGAHREATAPCT